MKQTILITGATGNIGAYLSLWLKEKGYYIIACGKRTNDNGFFYHHGIQYVQLDICNKKSFDGLPHSNIFAVVHLAGELPSRYEYNPSQLIETITMGTCNVLEYMRKNGIMKIIFPQTPFDIWYKHNTPIPIRANDSRSYPPTGDHSIYTIAKNAAVDLIEHYHAAYGLAYYILRFFTIYEYHPNPYHYSDGIRKIMPYRLLIDKAMTGSPIEIWGDPSRKKEIVYIKDFCRLVEICIKTEGKGGIYNVGGNLVSLEEQIKGIIEVFSPHSKKSPISYRPDMPNSLQACFDVSKTESELGYKPHYTYIDAMKDFLFEMKENRFKELWGTRDDYEFNALYNG